MGKRIRWEVHPFFFLQYIQKVLSLRCLKEITNMKEKMSNMKVTAAERDLIEQIRNYNISYPNGYPELMWFVQETLDKMLRQPYE